MTRTERDRPAALAVSEASQAKANRENAIRDAMPELLEALVDVMFRHVPFDNKSEYANKARAAIAKATGEQT